MPPLKPISDFRLRIPDCKSSPVTQTIFSFDNNNIVLVEYRHEFLFEIFLPEFAFVKLVSHSFATLFIRKSAHPEERVIILNREKRSKNLHADFLVSGEGLCF